MSKSSTPKIITKHLLNPKSLRKGEFVEKLKSQLTSYFQTPTVPLNSGRSAIYLALKSLGISQNDEVLIQAFTCNAVPNPVLWVGAVPIYVDINRENLNMSLTDLEKKITPRSKAIIVQHTFGNPAPIREILKIAEQYKLKVIEDCAHALGAKVDGKLLGTFGDLAILSFGREKVISSLTGGALIVNDQSLVKTVESEIKALKLLPLVKIIQEMVNYFSWRLLFRKINQTDWGNSFIKHLYQFDFVNVITSQKELDGMNPGWYPTLLPNIFAHIALEELSYIDSYNRQRIETAQKYIEKLKSKKTCLIVSENSIYLRIAFLSRRSAQIFQAARDKKLAFGNWYNNVVYPDSVHLAKLGYISGSCPEAESVVKEVINLPNYFGITDKEISEAVDLILKFS